MHGADIVSLERVNIYTRHSNLERAKLPPDSLNPLGQSLEMGEYCSLIKNRTRVMVGFRRFLCEMSDVGCSCNLHFTCTAELRVSRQRGLRVKQNGFTRSVNKVSVFHVSFAVPLC